MLERDIIWMAHDILDKRMDVGKMIHTRTEFEMGRGMETAMGKNNTNP
jgi:hypothetical protein